MQLLLHCRGNGAPRYPWRIRAVGTAGDRAPPGRRVWGDDPPGDRGADGTIDCGWRTLHGARSAGTQAVYTIRGLRPDAAAWWTIETSRHAAAGRRRGARAIARPDAAHVGRLETGDAVAMTDRRPPRAAEWLVERSLPIDTAEREAVLGDLA